MRLTKADLMQIGRDWFPYTYGVDSSDAGAIKAAWSACEARNYSKMIQSGGLRVLAIAAARWCQQGFPTLRFASHKYAAALCNTYARVADADLHIPWRAFLLEVPTQLLRFETRPGGVDEYRFALVQQVDQADGRWLAVCNVPANNDEVSCTAQPFADILCVSGASEVDECFVDGICKLVPSTGTEQRCKAGEALIRLAVNASIALGDRTAWKPAGKRAVCSHSPMPGQLGPQCAYVLGRPIVVDCRVALREYIEGRRHHAPMVQWLVRGHWRNQACGPRLTERRPRWIEPHWKGAEDAPINIRPHVLHRSEGAGT